MNENSVPQNAATDSIVLEEEIDPDYIPTDLEVEEYAKWLGIDTDGDRDMLWIAREGLMAPLPKSWKPCKTKDTDDIYYFNFETGESTWDHPCDGYYKEVYADERKKKEIKLKRDRDEMLASQAKQNMELLTGSRETKKPKKRPSEGTPSLIPTLDRSPKPVKGSSLPETNRSLGTAPQTSKISIGESHTSSFFEKSEPDNDQTVESRRNASKSAPPKSAGAPQEMSKQPQSDVNVTKSSVSSACPESDNEDKVPHSRADLGLGLKATRKLSTEGFSYEGSALENNDTGASSTPKAADKDDLQQLPSRRLQEGELDMEEWLLKEKHRNQMAELEQQFDKEEREFQEKMRIKRREMNRELEAFEIEYNQKILAGKAKLATTIEKDEKDRDTEKFQPLNNQVLFLTSKLRAAENAKLILENDMQSKEKVKSFYKDSQYIN